MAAGVTFDSVTKRFGDVHAVRELSLESGEGEFLVLVGPSGCGKTTALRMIAGLEEPTSGTIAIAGNPVNGVQPRDRDIAMVFQNYALYPHMSVYDNLAFGLKQRRTAKSEIRERVNEAAGLLGLDSLLERRPRELSGGQRQRVALGRAIVRRPRVFLMDEPLSNLDAHLRLRTRAEIAGLHRKLQTTFVYVTHDQVEAMTMGTRIAVMKDGLLQQVDTPQRLYDSPGNTFVAGFIGSPAMNLIEGDLVNAGEAFVFASPQATVPVPPIVAAPTGAVTLGIRPEHVMIGRPGEVATVSGMVTLVEPLGSDLYVTIEATGSLFVARLDPSMEVAVGQPLHLRIDSTRTHLFDRYEGSRLSLAARA